MHAFTIATTLLLAASSTLAAPTRRQTELDTKVRIILRSDLGGKTEVDFADVETNLSTGTNFLANTVEIDLGPDQNRALRCQVSGEDGVPILATRGANLDDTFSDATKGEWRFDGAQSITIVRCDQNFVANNRNTAA